MSQPNATEASAEARALAAINHPNVVHVHTIGMRHGQPYIVMELLIGSEKLNVMLKEGWIADDPWTLYWRFRLPSRTARSSAERMAPD